MSKLEKISKSEFNKNAELSADGNALVIKNAYYIQDSTGQNRSYDIVVRQNNHDLSSRKNERSLISDIQNLFDESTKKLKTSVNQIEKIIIEKNAIKAQVNQKNRTLTKTKTNQKVFRKIALLDAIDKTDEEEMIKCLDRFEKKRTKEIPIPIYSQNDFSLQLDKTADEGKANSTLFDKKSSYSAMEEVLRLGLDPKTLKSSPRLKFYVIAALIATIATAILAPIIAPISTGVLLSLSLVVFAYNLKKLRSEKKQASEAKNTLEGAYLGTMPVQNDRAIIEITGKMKTFFNRTDKLITTEKHATNSPTTPGAITSSYNRLAETTTNLRQVTTTLKDQSENTSDYYTGRVHNLQTAIEQASFLFTSEFEKDQAIQKGIKKINDRTYEFRF